MLIGFRVLRRRVSSVMYTYSTIYFVIFLWSATVVVFDVSQCSFGTLCIQPGLCARRLGWQGGRPAAAAAASYPIEAVMTLTISLWRKYRRRCVLHFRIYVYTTRKKYIPHAILINFSQQSYHVVELGKCLRCIDICNIRRPLKIYIETIFRIYLFSKRHIPKIMIMTMIWYYYRTHTGRSPYRRLCHHFHLYFINTRIDIISNLIIVIYLSIYLPIVFYSNVFFSSFFIAIVYILAVIGTYFWL